MKALGDSLDFEVPKGTHPSWDQRLARLDREQSQLWKAMSAFRNGNYFLLVEQFGLASQCYEHVVQEFPNFHEARANLGYARLMLYCDKLRDEDLRRIYGNMGYVAASAFYNRSVQQIPLREIDDKLWDEATDALQSAAAHDRNLVLARANLGLAYLVAPPGRRDPKKALLLLQEALALFDRDDRADAMAHASVLINAGIADLANSQRQEGEKKFKLANAKIQGLIVADDLQAAGNQLLSAQHHNLALWFAASADPKERSKAVGEFELFLRGTSPACTWWPVAYDHYVRLCKELDVPAQPREYMAKVAAKKASWRPVVSLKLKSGDTLTLNGKPSQIPKKL